MRWGCECDMKVLLKIAYVGTDYAGFQVQPNAVAVQRVLCDAAKAVFGCECDVTGCSRTDSGVHALGFVAAVTPKGRRGFDRGVPIPAGRIGRAFARALPGDVSILGAAFADDSFHPRYDAVRKEYVYRLYTGARDPFREDRALWLPKALGDGEFSLAEACAAKYVGEHDFRAFMAAGSPKDDTVRTVYESRLEKADCEMTFTVSANGFLYNMVRIMVGTLVDCARGSVTLADVDEAFATGRRDLLGRTAPACGLYLNNVEYPEPIDWQND